MRHGRGSWLRHTLLFAAGLLLIGLYIWRADPEAVLSAVLSVPAWVPLAVGLLFGAVWGLRVWSLEFLSRGTAYPLTWKEANEAFLGSNALNILLPARLGDVNLAVALSRHRPASSVTALVLHWRAQSLLALLALAGGLALASASGVPDTASAYAVVFLAQLTLLVVGGLALWLLAAGSDSLAHRLLDRLDARWPGNRWIGRSRRLVEAGSRLFEPRVLVPALLIAGTAWFLEALLAVPFILVLAPEVSAGVALAAPVAAALAGMVRIIPGGFGLYEGAFAAVLVGGGAQLAPAVAAGTIAHGFVTLLLLVLGAGPGYALTRRTAEQTVEALADARDEPPEAPTPEVDA